MSENTGGAGEQPPSLSKGGKSSALRQELRSDKRCVMQCLGGADATAMAPLVGLYLKSYDSEADGGLGTLSEWTGAVAEARVFADAGELIECWQQVRRRDPVRHDGKPNRPLTAFTVRAVPLRRLMQ